MQPLEGIGVLVTRPQPQSAPLCHLLIEAGAHALCFPTIDIVPLGDARAIAATLGPLERFDLVIFLSANAVRYGADLLGQRRDLTLAAIGPATARALNRAGYRVGVRPESGYDSEALLAHPRLRSTAGKRILLVKGEGGRDHLRSELERRGAEVHSAPVYRRIPAQPSLEARRALEAALEAGGIHVVTVTSAEVGLGLLDLAGATARTALERLPWIVPGPRVAEALRAGGVRAPLRSADGAEDQSVLEALLRWRAGESDAKSNAST